MRMRQYICYTDHNLWDIIVNGDLEDEATPSEEQSSPPVPKTTKQLAARRNQERIKSILLLAILDEYLLKLHNVPDAKSLWVAIKSRFGEGSQTCMGLWQKGKSPKEIHGAYVSKEDINQKFLRSLPPSWSQIALIMRNKPDIDEIDIDDLYNNLRVYEDEMKKSSTSSSNTQNLAFLSSENTNSTNEVSTVSGDFGVSTAGGINQVPSTLSAHDIAYSFLAQPTTSGYVDCQSKEVHSEDRKKYGLQRKTTWVGPRLMRDDVYGCVKTVSSVKPNVTQAVRSQADKSGQTSQKQGISFKKVHKIKACFVCKSTGHLIKDYDFYKSPEPRVKNVVNTGKRGCKVAACALLPPGTARVTHLASLTKRLEDLPLKTIDMVTAEIPCRKAERVAGNKDTGKEGASKKRRVRIVTLVQPDSEHVSSPIPLNHAKPLETLANEEHVSPTTSAEFVTGGEGVQENDDATFANEGHGDNEGGLSGLQTQPSPINHLGRHPKSVTPLGVSALTEEHADLVYDHESCKDMKTRDKECNKELVKAQSAYDEKDRLEELEDEKKETDQLDREKYAVEAGNGEMVRRQIINEYLPIFLRRLSQSVEYKHSLGEAFGLAIGKDHKSNFVRFHSSSSSSSSSDNKVQNCSKCLESFKCLQKNYNTEREKHNKARLEIRGYEIALESLEDRILGHEKNELAWGEKYEFQNYDLKCREIKINNLNTELEKVVKERDELKLKIEKWEGSSKNLTKIINSQMSAHDKNGLGFGTQIDELSNKSETDSENSMTVFEVRSSDEESTLGNSRFTKATEYHVVPPPITGNPLTPRADISFAGLDEYAIRNKIIESKTLETTKTLGNTNDKNAEKPKSVNEKVVSKTGFNRDEVIIEDWTSDDEEDMCPVNTVSSVKPKVTQAVRIQAVENGQTSHKQGIDFKKVHKIKACFVCKSTDHLIKDCDFYDQKSPEPRVNNVVNTGKREVKPVWDYGKRVNHQNFSKNWKYPHAKRTFNPSAVLTRAGLVNTDRSNVSIARSISTVRHVYTVRPISTARSYFTQPVYRPKDLKPNVKTFGIKNITTVGTRAVVSKDKVENVLKRLNRPKRDFQDHALVDSGCSSHMTGNRAYLLAYEDLNRGFVAFGSDPKGVQEADNCGKAEYVAAAHCCGQVLWIQNQMMDYGFNFMNTKIHIDNESTICVVKNPVYHLRTNHIEIRHHFIRDYYEKRLIDVPKIHTDSNVADLLTKGFDVTSMDLRIDRSSPGKYNSSMVFHMANLKYFDKHNMVAFLKKPNESVGFTEVVDFLKDATGIHNLSDAKIYAGLATLGYLASTLTKKLFANMKRGYARDIVPLLPAMLARAVVDQAPLPEGNTSGSAEDSVQLKELMVLVSKLVTKINSLEKELKDTKHTLGNVVLKLVKKVKTLETALKRKSKKVLISESEGEESEDQGRKFQDIDEDPLVSLVRESMKEKSTDFVTPTKASGEAHKEEISPTILEAAKTLSKVTSQGVSKEKSTDKGKRYKRRARSMAKKIDTGLDAEEEINTGREEINTGIEEVSTGSTKVDSGTTSKRGQREGKAPMVEEDFQATHKTKEQLRQEEAGLEEAIKLQAQLDEEVAKQIHLDKMIAKRMTEEEALTKQQKKTEAQV
ncbi:hypothetical protein Tco_0169474 [Tanacetum coccineum]